MLKKITALLFMFFLLGLNAEQKYTGFHDPESVAEGPDGAIYVSCLLYTSDAADE